MATTNFDEENIMLALFAKSLSSAKLITKVHRISYDDIIDQLDVGSIIYPGNLLLPRVLSSMYVL